MIRMSGGCQCGRVRFAADVEPGNAYACHSTTARKASGGAWAAYIGVSMDGVAWNGKPDWYQSSIDVHHAFCSRCGTPLGFAFVDDLSRVDLTIGSFDEPHRFRPARNQAVESMLPAWADLSGLPGEHGDESAIIARRLRAGGVEPAR